MKNTHIIEFIIILDLLYEHESSKNLYKQKYISCSEIFKISHGLIFSTEIIYKNFIYFSCYLNQTLCYFYEKDVISKN